MDSLTKSHIACNIIPIFGCLGPWINHLPLYNGSCFGKSVLYNLVYKFYRMADKLTITLDVYYHLSVYFTSHNMNSFKVDSSTLLSISHRRDPYSFQLVKPSLLFIIIILRSGSYDCTRGRVLFLTWISCIWIVFRPAIFYVNSGSLFHT